MAGSCAKILDLLRKGKTESTGIRGTITIQLYGKKDCHLCDVAKDVLYRVREEIPFDLQEIDIESREDLYGEFKEKIPVIFINGKQVFMYKINEKRLRRILGNASHGAQR
ncbi:MAG: glutaredoxin family protein [Proteobacteria bacterium]|nr:glutaredoxin family protein [Pseudomonadota bacterium]NIS70012.1 glutaredoxin family protein [Pseudomonadota bacterium]